MGINSVAKIGTGGPTTTGGVQVAVAGTTLPVGLASPVSFTRLGYVAEDGLKPSGSRTSSEILDWAGDVIAQPQDKHSSAFGFKLYQVYDSDVLGAVFGAAQVTTVGSLVSVVENGEPLDIHPWLFDMRGSNGKRTRIAIPLGQLTDIKEDPFVRNKLQAFDCTITCYKDSSGNKVYRYYDDGSVASVPVISSNAPSGTFATAGGQIIVLTGTNFTGTTGVTFGGTAALDFEIVSDQTLSVITPAKSAGSVDIIVTNGTGASAAYAITYA